MEALLSLPALVLMALLGVSSVKVTSGGQSRLVERLGKYDRQLQPGLSLVLPVLEKVVSHESLKERVLDPAGLTDTVLALRDGDAARLMQGHNFDGSALPKPLT